MGTTLSCFRQPGDGATHGNDRVRQSSMGTLVDNSVPSSFKSVCPDGSAIQKFKVTSSHHPVVQSSKATSNDPVVQSSEAASSNEQTGQHSEITTSDASTTQSPKATCPNYSAVESPEVTAPPPYEGPEDKFPNTPVTQCKRCKRLCEPGAFEDGIGSPYCDWYHTGNSVSLREFIDEGGADVDTNDHHRGELDHKNVWPCCLQEKSISEGPFVSRATQDWRGLDKGKLGCVEYKGKHTAV